MAKKAIKKVNSDLVPVLIKFDSEVLEALKNEAESLGIPYQTHIKMILKKHTKRAAK